MGYRPGRRPVSYFDELACAGSEPWKRILTLEEHWRACLEARTKRSVALSPAEIEAILPDLIERFGADVYTGILALDAGIITSRICRATGLDVSYEMVNTHLTLVYQELIAEAACIEEAERLQEEQRKAEIAVDPPEWSSPFPVKIYKGQLASGELRRFIVEHGGYWLRGAADLYRIAQKRGVPVSKNSLALALSRWRKEHQRDEEPDIAPRK